MLADIRPGIRTLLLSSPDIAAMVGTRVYPIVLPQGETEDSIVYNRIVESESYHFVGGSGLISTRMQIDAWSRDLDRAHVLGDLIKEFIGGFKGQINYGSSSPQDYVNINGIFMLNGDEDFDNLSLMYRRRRDYSVIYGDRNA